MFHKSKVSLCGVWMDSVQRCTRKIVCNAMIQPRQWNTWKIPHNNMGTMCTNRQWSFSMSWMFLVLEFLDIKCEWCFGRQQSCICSQGGVERALHLKWTVSKLKITICSLNTTLQCHHCCSTFWLLVYIDYYLSIHGSPWSFYLSIVYLVYVYIYGF